MTLNTLASFEKHYNTLPLEIDEEETEETEETKETEKSEQPAQWLRGKTVLVRVDFNVPLNKSLQITDDNRITAAIPTITWLKERGAVVVLMSHLGRPKGTKNHRLSLLPVADRLQKLLDQTIYFCDAMDEPETLTRSLKSGDVVLLENLRFESGEESDDQRFAQKLSMIGDFYVNDAFGLVHRAHASVHALAKHFSSKDASNNRAFAGFLIEKETAALNLLLERNSKSTTVAVLGGSKVSDKIVLVENLARHSRNILIGGAMGYTLMKANKIDVGTSKVEKDKLSVARELLDLCAKMKVNVHLPVDHLCKSSFSEEEEVVIVDSPDIPDGLMGLDIGPKTRELYSALVASAGCVFWNGPMGVFEWEDTAEGTRSIGKALNSCTQNGGYTIVGGGDSAAAVGQMELTEHISHISTGGGASLAYLEERPLPGIIYIQNNR
jgi:phosphoglycerate kinase